jgi:NAD(P)-dependent dehydrogenase (short-subunit alcohol dehydrogenase family)
MCRHNILVNPGVGKLVEIKDKVAVVTGAASGIGRAVCRDLALRGVKMVAMVDFTEALNEVAEQVNEEAGREVAVPYLGDVTDEAFRKGVYQELRDKHGSVNICVPAAGITRDSLSLRVNKETGKADIYPAETFRSVIEVNLIAPVYWALEMVGILAEERKRQGLGRWKPDEGIQGTVVFIGSVSSQGNKGQISYASTKAGLEGAAATLMKEAIFFGVRCGVIHPGFTDTPMVRALGEEYIEKYILPDTQLGRLIRPDEIADAICFMITNAAISGEIWADAGWHPAA